MVEIVKYFSVVVHIEGGGLALWFCASLLADMNCVSMGSSYLFAGKSVWPFEERGNVLNNITAKPRS